MDWRKGDVLDVIGVGQQVFNHKIGLGRIPPHGKELRRMMGAPEISAVRDQQLSDIVREIIRRHLHQPIPRQVTDIQILTGRNKVEVFGVYALGEDRCRVIRRHNALLSIDRQWRRRLVRFMIKPATPLPKTNSKAVEGSGTMMPSRNQRSLPVKGCSPP